jgi:hypothetical protein
MPRMASVMAAHYPRPADAYPAGPRTQAVADLGSPRPHDRSGRTRSPDEHDAVAQAYRAHEAPG